MNKLLLTPEEAAEIVSVGRSKIYDLLRTGQIESVKIGGSRRIPVEALDRFVEWLREESSGYAV